MVICTSAIVAIYMNARGLCWLASIINDSLMDSIVMFLSSWQIAVARESGHCVDGVRERERKQDRYKA